MKKLITITILSVLVSLGITGCSKKHQSESKVPWARPASWEGGMPGLGF